MIPLTSLLEFMKLVLVVRVLLVPGLPVNIRIWVAPLALRGRPMALWITRLVPCGLILRCTDILIAELKEAPEARPVRVIVLLVGHSCLWLIPRVVLAHPPLRRTGPLPD